MRRPALLRAEAKVAGELQKNPDDVKWLQAEGRVNLLEDTAPSDEVAVSALEKAHRLSPGDNSVSTDLASAYLMRGEFLNTPADIGVAAEMLGRVTGSDPGDESAQFNYALALEKLFLKEQALAAWQNFLARFPRSAWAGEAKDHLDHIQKQIQDRNSRSEAPLDTPAQVARVFQTHAQAEIEAIDNRIEEYQDLAVQQWLPSYFSSSGESPQKLKDLEDGLADLGILLRREHGDSWLADLLAARPRTPPLGRAVSLLAQSELNISMAKNSEARAELLQAVRLFHQSQVPAGEVRADFDQALLEQVQHRGDPCARIAEATQHNGLLVRYSWLKIQIALEAGVCGPVNIRGSLDPVRKSLSEASSCRFPILRLRALAFEGDLYASLGDSSNAWSSIMQGEQDYWAGVYPRLRGYNLLVTLDYLVEPRQQYFLEAAILKEALPMVDGDGRINMIAVERSRLAQTLLQIGDISEAEKNYRITDALLHRAPPGPQRDALGAEILLGFAKVDLNRGNYSAAEGALQAARKNITALPDDLLRLDFWGTSGQLEARLNHLDDAARDVDAAVRVAESDLRKDRSGIDRWRWARRNEAVYRTLVEVELSTDPRQALLDWEWYKAAPLSGLHPRLVMNPSSAGSSLPGQRTRPAFDKETHSALVSYAVLPKGIAVWVWNADGIREKWLPINIDVVSALTARFREHLSEPESDLSALRQEGATLFQLLMAPVEPWIAADNHLIFEPDGVLQSIPMELLVDKSGRFFGDRFAISYSPGTQYLKNARPWVGISYKDTALIVANPRFPDVAPLPDADQEGRSVAADFVHANLILDENIEPRAFAASLKKASVFHFSGDSAALTGLANSETATSFFISPDLQHNTALFSNQKLVVLSACSTSQGTNSPGDDAGNLVRSLISSGVPEVVASRWSVDSSSTAQLMTILYSHLLAGQPPSLALQSARLAIRSRPEFTHPYYWGAFSVFGHN
jgi:CHAT domain-containing protein